MLRHTVKTREIEMAEGTKFFTREGSEVPARYAHTIDRIKYFMYVPEPKGYIRASGDGSRPVEVIYTEEQYAALCAAREKRAAKAAPKIAAAMAAFEAKHPGLIAWASQQKSNFCKSVVDQFNKKGSLSEAQVAVLERIRQK